MTAGVKVCHHEAPAVLATPKVDNGGASSYPGVVAMPGWLAIVLSLLALGIVLTLALAWITNHPD